MLARSANESGGLGAPLPAEHGREPVLRRDSNICPALMVICICNGSRLTTSILMLPAGMEMSISVESSRPDSSAPPLVMGPNENAGRSRTLSDDEEEP